MGYKIAVVGATGNVGREMLNTLAERKFPADEIFALASSKSIGRTVGYGEDDEISVLDAATFDFSKADIALFSAGGETAKKLAPKAAEAGCVVIDNSSYWRMEPGARGQWRCAGRIRQKEHHRQSELLDHSDGSGP